MNDFEDKGVAITLGVLAMAAAVLVGTQLRWVSSEKGMLERQLSTLADRSTAAKNAKKQLEEVVQQREAQIKLAMETETKYAALLTELLELAKTDLDAQQITQKWKIQGAPSVPQAAPTGAAEPKAPLPKAPLPEAAHRLETSPAKTPAGR